MRLRDLYDGVLFVFEKDPSFPWEYRGQGWYSNPRCCDGGPWYCDGNPYVMIYEPELLFKECDDVDAIFQAV